MKHAAELDSERRPAATAAETAHAPQAAGAGRAQIDTEAGIGGRGAASAAVDGVWWTAWWRRPAAAAAATEIAALRCNHLHADRWQDRQAFDLIV